jgi:hypothetical protein
VEWVLQIAGFLGSIGVTFAHIADRKWKSRKTTSKPIINAPITVRN